MACRSSCWLPVAARLHVNCAFWNRERAVRRYRKAHEKTRLLNVDEMKAILGQHSSVSISERVNCAVMCLALSVSGKLAVAETKAFCGPEHREERRAGDKTGERNIYDVHGKGKDK